MEVSETVFMFVVVPAALVLIIGGAAYAMGGGRRSRRYRPGRPFDAAPVWFLAASGPGPSPAGDDSGAAGRPRVGSRPVSALSTGPGSGGQAAPQGATGGASDQW